MDDRTSQGWAHLALPLYLSGAVLVVMPLVDYVTNVAPFVVGNLQWRYGAVGLLAGFMHTPLLGLLLVIAAAVVRGDHRVQRIVGVLSIVLAVTILLLTGLFSLDVLQLRREVKPEGLSMFQLGAAKAAFKHLVSVVVFGWLGLGLYKGAQKGKRQRSEPAAPLIRPA